MGDGRFDARLVVVVVVVDSEWMDMRWQWAIGGRDAEGELRRAVTGTLWHGTGAEGTSKVFVRLVLGWWLGLHLAATGQAQC